MERDAAFVIDILHEARTALGFVAGKSYREFEDDIQCQYAVIRAIEVMGEAARLGAWEWKASSPKAGLCP